MIEKMAGKIRPITSIKWDNGNDGRDEGYYIHYSCPKCGRGIPYYKSDTACDKCGTIYYWGTSLPEIKIIRSIEWSVRDE